MESQGNWGLNCSPKTLSASSVSPPVVFAVFWCIWLSQFQFLENLQGRSNYLLVFPRTIFRFTLSVLLGMLPLGYLLPSFQKLLCLFTLFSLSLWDYALKNNQQQPPPLVVSVGYWEEIKITMNLGDVILSSLHFCLLAGFCVLVLSFLINSASPPGLLLLFIFFRMS